MPKAWVLSFDVDAATGVWQTRLHRAANHVLKEVLFSRKELFAVLLMKTSRSFWHDINSLRQRHIE